MRWPLALRVLVVLSLAAPLAAAQSPAPPGGAEDEEAASEPDAAPGRFHIGPFYVTPTFKIGTVGVDTNVFYTSTDRRTDGTATGGPGLNIVLPIRKALQLNVDGNISYTYFVRTGSQRRLGGGASAGLTWEGTRARAGVSYSSAQTFARPSYEVDDRILQRAETYQGQVESRVFGRFHLSLGGEQTRNRVLGEAVFRGSNLQKTLNATAITGRAALRYGITSKTSAQVEASRRWNEFARDPSRDGRSDEIRFGLQTSSTALLSGHAFMGLGRTHLDARPGEPQKLVTADLAITWHVSPRTRLLGSWLRERRYSALEIPGALPTVLVRTYSAGAEKELWGRRLDLRLGGSVQKLRTDSPAVAVTEPPPPVKADTARSAHADLGYRFRSRLRVGLVAGYTERSSTFADLGIHGLLLGASVTYTP